MGIDLVGCGFVRLVCEVVEGEFMYLERVCSGDRTVYLTGESLGMED